MCLNESCKENKQRKGVLNYFSFDKSLIVMVCTVSVLCVVLRISSVFVSSMINVSRLNR